MAEIKATMVKDLREKTGAPFLDCKNALVELSLIHISEPTRPY